MTRGSVLCFHIVAFELIVHMRAVAVVSICCSDCHTVYAVDVELTASSVRVDPVNVMTVKKGQFHDGSNSFVIPERTQRTNLSITFEPYRS